MLPLLSLIAPLVLLPIVAARFGTTGWTAVALGQSLGAVASVAISLAWPVIGGNLVARSTADERATIYMRSLVSRGLVCAVVLPSFVALSFLLAPEYPWQTAGFMVGIALNGMTAAWFYAGTGTPRHLVANEGAVRTTAYLLAAVALAMGADLGAYSAASVAGGVTSILLNARTILASSAKERIPFRQRIAVGVDELRNQARGTGARLLQAAFNFSGVSIYSAVAPQSLATFAAADQVAKAATNAGSVLPQTFVSWVGGAPRSRQREITSLAAVGSLLLVGFGIWLVVASPVLGFMFAGSSMLSPADVVLIGLMVGGMISVQAVELLLLVPRGLERKIYAARSTVSVAGIVALAAAAAAFGVTAALGVYVAAAIAYLFFYSLVLSAHQST